MKQVSEQVCTGAVANVEAEGISERAENVCELQKEQGLTTKRPTSPAISTGGTCCSTCCRGSLRRAPRSGSRGSI